MPEWFCVARELHVVRRALASALVVGAVLSAINHGDALLRGELGAGRLLRMGLTALVPYLVSTYSSVGAIRRARAAERRAGATAPEGGPGPGPGRAPACAPGRRS